MTWTTRPRSRLSSGLTAIRAGTGDPVILIHGVGLNADSWGAQIDALAKRFSVTAIDLPGHGQSKRLVAYAGMEDWVDTIAAGLAEIAPPYRIAGHSLGALLTLHLAVRYPDLCERLALLNTIHRRSPKAASAVKARARALRDNGRSDPVPTLERWFGADLDSAPARACRTWLETVDAPAYAEAYALFAEGDSPPDDALAGLACPALFLTGAAEPNSTPAMSEELAALVPKGRALIVPDAAHMAMMTHPATVNGALIDFFTGPQTEG
ncbi:alpha/beta fold hydrolase [Hwanghaeella sp.]|uniref:alpha/beta fold hydrolase n=1 Tax=Hwanghaeella sp. TaxID=2605943 RepID=UPI003CCBC244